MAFVLARHRSQYEYAEDDEINEIIGNNKLHSHFIELARDLDVVEPKTPEDIYKSHLADTGFSQRVRRTQVSKQKETMQKART